LILVKRALQLKLKQGLARMDVEEVSDRRQIDRWALRIKLI
jgi:hypothetical protein